MPIERVLIVEDDEVQARAISSAFAKRIGGTASQEEKAPWTSDLRDALIRLSREPESFSVVVLDMKFAERDDQGIRLLKFLRLAGLAAPTTPVVILTALDDISICVRAMQAGAADYVLKGAPKAPRLDEDTIDRTIEACEAAVARATRAEEKAIDEWLRVSEQDLRQTYPGKFIVIFLKPHNVPRPETLGGRDFLAFDGQQAAITAFLEHMEWLDNEIRFAMVPGA